MSRRGPYKRRPPAGTVAALILAFRESPTYRQWAPSTRYHHDRRLSRLQRLNGTILVRDISRGDMIHYRDQMADTPGEGNNCLKVLRQLFEYAVDLEWIEATPLATVRPLKMQNPDGLPAWTEPEIETFLAHWSPGTTANAAARLVLATGAARADLVGLGWQSLHEGGARLRYRRQKMKGRGGVEIDIPVLPDLAELLATLPRDRMTFLATGRGTPYRPHSLTENMARWVDRAGLPAGHNLHGLRKALGRRLAEAGSSPHVIMSWLGHETLEQAAHYSRAYDRARAADAGAELLGNNSGAQGRVVRLK